VKFENLLSAIFLDLSYQFLSLSRAKTPLQAWIFKLIRSCMFLTSTSPK